MNEDRIMYKVGIWSLGFVFLLMAVLQVCYSTQNRALNAVRADIVRTQQAIAKSQANFASYVRPEALRSLVSIVAPKSEAISFQKSVAPSDIPARVVESK